MPYYKVIYKIDADNDGKTWPLGPVPDAYVALAIFNNTYAREKTVAPLRFGRKAQFTDLGLLTAGAARTQRASSKKVRPLNLAAIKPNQPHGPGNDARQHAEWTCERQMWPQALRLQNELSPMTGACLSPSRFPVRDLAGRSVARLEQVSASACQRACAFGRSDCSAMVIKAASNRRYSSELIADLPR
jgi:hypothetical protein